jgi:ankyrin repeat protein
MHDLLEGHDCVPVAKFRFLHWPGGPAQFEPRSDNSTVKNGRWDEYTICDDSRYGDHPLVHRLAICNKIMALLVLIDCRGVVVCSDGYGFTGLHVACFRDNVDIVRVLLDSGHPPDVSSKAGWTPLHIASLMGCPATVQVLLDNGADPNARNCIRATPIFMASLAERRSELQRRFRDFDRARAQRLSRRPLTEAMDASEVKDRSYRKSASPGTTQVIRTLLKHGAKLNVSDNTGSTPLLLASAFASVDVVTLLLEQGGNINATDDQGQTVSDLASQRPEILRLLIEHGAPPPKRVSEKKVIAGASDSRVDVHEPRVAYVREQTRRPGRKGGLFNWSRRIG